MMSTQEVCVRFQDGDRVCIIGGGPAGSFAALHLLAQAEQRGLRLDVLIFEPRDFSRPGPAGCNRCAGVLSSRLLRGLNTLGLHLPDTVAQSELHTYALVLNNEVVRVRQPDPTRRVVGIYRGGGPKHFLNAPSASFDAWLLSQAQARGARHVPARAYLVTQENGYPVVHSRQGRYQAAFLVLATGINSRPPLDASFGYRPPSSEMMAQDEVLLPPDWPEGEVRAYFRTLPWLTFGALIPKRNYLNISLLGRHIPRDGVDAFLERIRLSLGAEPLEKVRLCGCTPRVTTGVAHPVCGDRWVAVGDAAVSRLYKDGIGSAFYTARAAMKAAVTHGISRRSLSRHYALYCRRVHWDNRWGRALFALWHFTLGTPLLLRAWKRALLREAKRPQAERVHERILWGMFTGDEPYGRLFLLAITPTAVWRVAREMCFSGEGDL